MPGDHPHAFASRAQWRLFMAKAKGSPRWKKWAHDKAHATPGGPVARYRHLPERKNRPGPRSVR